MLPNAVPPLTAREKIQQRTAAQRFSALRFFLTPQLFFVCVLTPLISLLKGEDFKFEMLANKVEIVPFSCASESSNPADCSVVVDWVKQILAKA